MEKMQRRMVASSFLLAAMILVASCADARFDRGDPVDRAVAVSAQALQTERARVWINYHPGAKGHARAALVARGGEVLYDFEDLEALVVSVPPAALAGLERNPHVVRIEEDAIRYADVQTIPYGVGLVQAPAVWDANADGQLDANAPTGAGRKVCIIDSGYDVAHSDLPATGVTGYTRNLAWNQDGCGHGTHVAGTISAVNDDAGVVGAAPGVSLHIVRVFGNDCRWTYSSTLVDAANRCRDGGANVINMSLGGSGWSFNEYAKFQELWEQGIVAVAAAGNGGTGAYSYPASYPSVISVAAIDAAKQIAGFSQFNDDVELAAPGVGVLSTVPGGGHEAWSGTSMATPHVAAVTALVWSANPLWKPAQVRNALKRSAEDLGGAGRDVYFGHGLARAQAALAYLAAEDPASADTTPPTISAVSSRKLSNKGVFEIAWTTNEPSDSVVTLTCCGTYRNAALVTTHRMTFNGTPKGSYTFYVGSTDAAENRAHRGSFLHRN
jgi:subtilisin family serine protease